MTPLLLSCWTRLTHGRRRGLSLLLGFLVAGALECCAIAAHAQPAIDGYANYETFRDQLQSLDKSEAVALESLGRTLGKREVYLLTIGQGKPAEKPAILIMGGVHAPHLAGSELAVRLARRLAEGADKDEAVKQLLARFTIYIIPRPSPDAAEAFFRPPYYERTGNERPTDDDRDGETDEDGPNDLNRDGQITMMRVEDETGSYMPHPDDPRVLIKADPAKNERGRYSLYSEGRDDDEDEQFNEDGAGGVAFDRNFTFRYPFFQSGAGPNQVSEVETRAVADFAFTHPNISLVFSFSPDDNLMEPWKANANAEAERIKTSVLAADADPLNYLAEQYRAIHGEKDAPAAGGAEGSLVHWAYFHYGRWSLGARAWWIPPASAAGKEDKDAAKEPAEKAEAEKRDEKKDAAKEDSKEAAEPEKAKEPDRDEKAASQKDTDQKDAKKPGSAAKMSGEKRGAADIRALEWFKSQNISGFVPWTPVEHPDFPGKKVEVGGFKPYLRLNPPAALLDDLADKHLKFLARVAELSPGVKIQEAKVAALGGGAFRVSVTVTNPGYLATMPAMGRRTREAYPLQLKIELPAEAKLLTGFPRERLEPIAGGGKAEHAWLILIDEKAAAARSAKLSVSSPSVGSDSKTIELK